ncbi:hypothetical protein [Chania multitudinisentens]|uniref:hypothetical protein n=1 Tax=Chania multitudinisentens TaxID=1639108 RepID=UPI0003E13C50|nr:hypothetical protein [Chania multitudinisentens]
MTCNVRKKAVCLLLGLLAGTAQAVIDINPKVAVIQGDSLKGSVVNTGDKSEFGADV